MRHQCLHGVLSYFPNDACTNPSEHRQETHHQQPASSLTAYATCAAFTLYAVAKMIVFAVCVRERERGRVRCMIPRTQTNTAVAAFLAFPPTILPALRLVHQSTCACACCTRLTIGVASFVREGSVAVATSLDASGHERVNIRTPLSGFITPHGGAFIGFDCALSPSRYAVGTLGSRGLSQTPIASPVLQGTHPRTQQTSL